MREVEGGGGCGAAVVVVLCAVVGFGAADQTREINKSQPATEEHFLFRLLNSSSC